MNRLTKLALTAAAVLTVSSVPVFAGAGIFGTAGVITYTSSGVTVNDLLEATGLNDSRLQPFDPTLSPISYDTSGNDANGTLNLGSFNVANGDTLNFDGGEVLTYKSGNDNFTGADVYFSINNGSYTKVPLAFNYDNVNSNAGDQRWYTDNYSSGNLLTGLANGTYTVNFYFDATDNHGDGIYTPVVNNGGPPNYTATFTVVPEPSSIMMLLSSGLLGSFYLIRRRRS